MSLVAAVKGTQWGLEAAEFKRLEDSVQAGESAYFSASLQAVQGLRLWGASGLLHEAKAISSLSKKSVVCLVGAPFLLGAVKASHILPQKVQPLVHFMQENLGTVYHVALLVSSVALLYLGQTYFALSFFISLSLGYLDRWGVLPVEIRQGMHSFLLPVLVALDIVVGDWFDKVFAGIWLVATCAEWWMPKGSTQAAELLTPHPLDVKEAQDLLTLGPSALRIQPSYIHCSPSLPVPDCSLQGLVEDFDKVDWGKHASILRKKMAADRRFVERSDGCETDAQIVQFARESLLAFVTSVQERRVLQGEPADYTRLEEYLKVITDHVRRCEDETERVDILMRLAVEGGKYCGPGKFEVAENLYAQILLASHELSFLDKVLSCLQSARNRWMQSHYYETFFAPGVRRMLGKVVEAEDLHTYTGFVNLYGGEFGLRKVAAENDDMGKVDALDRLLFARVFRGEFRKTFLDDAEHLVELVQEAIGTASLPKTEVYAFWRQWIERQSLSPEEKEALTDELMDCSLMGRPFEVDGVIQPAFIRLMLLEMGILERVPPASV